LKVTKNISDRIKEKSSRGRFEGHPERKITIKDDLINNIETRYLFSSATNSFKNNDSEPSYFAEIYRIHIEEGDDANV